MTRRRDTWRLWLGLQFALFLVQSAIAVIGIATVQFGALGAEPDWHAVWRTFALAGGAAIAGPAMQTLNTLKGKVEQLIAQKWPAAPPIEPVAPPEAAKAPRRKRRTTRARPEVIGAPHAP